MKFILVYSLLSATALATPSPSPSPSPRPTAATIGHRKPPKHEAPIPGYTPVVFTPSQKLQMLNNYHAQMLARRAQEDAAYAAQVAAIASPTPSPSPSP